MNWIWYALLNAFAISAVHIAQKRALRDEHSLEFSTIVTIIRLVVFYAIFWRSINWTVSNAQLLGLATTAMFAALGLWLISKAIRRQDLSSVIPIVNLDAGVTAIFALIFLGETLTGKQVLGLTTLVIGTYILNFHRHVDRSTTFIDVIIPFRSIWKHRDGRYALLGVLAFAGNATLDRTLLIGMTWQTYLAYVLPFMMVFYTMLSAARGHTFSMFRHQWRTILPWTILAAVFLLLSNIGNAVAASLAPIGLVIAIKRSSTLLDVFISGKIFHEHNLIQKAIAASVMLIGLFLILT